VTIASQADDRLLISGPAARHMLGDLGTTKYCELLNKGELERVNIGRRSFVTAESLHAYVERLRGDNIVEEKAPDENVEDDATVYPSAASSRKVPD
jgi:hypothetical protein